ncbi:MAG TPA: hypothetical protein VEL28_19260 [Candidatus Binatia bacterium]|nr:hypothetical protein [Candidatus Binatia bacterium]
MNSCTDIQSRPGLRLASILLAACAIVTPANAVATTCLTVAYNQTDLNTLIQKFNALAVTCVGVDNVWASIETIVVSKSDSNLGNFLKNYFKGCYHGNSPQPLTAVLAQRLLERPFVMDGDDSFERRLQRALAVAVTDKLLDEIASSGGVIALGQRMEGGNGVNADCAKRDEILSLLRLLSEVSEERRRMTPTFGDEVYTRFKTLLDQESAAMRMFGLSPDPDEYPWLGVFRAAIWRAMRMIKVYAGTGDSFKNSQVVRTQFADDIGVFGSYLQKHRDLIVDYGILLADGESFAQEDPFIHPFFGGTHELGYEQLQVKVIDRLMDLTPVDVAKSVFFISERNGMANVCVEDSGADTCVITTGMVGETLEEHFFVSSLPGTCSVSGTECIANADCTTTTQRWGPSGRPESRCPLPQKKQCPYGPYPSNPNAVQGSDDRCLALGVNIREFLVGDSAAVSNWLTAFPADTPEPTIRANYYPKFGQFLQHEMNHAVKSWIIDRDPALMARHAQLIDQSCDDVQQYLGGKTFCGQGTSGTCTWKSNPSCDEDEGEFFANNMNRYMVDTQTTLELARVRWNANKRQPVNHFLFIAGIYSSSAGTAFVTPFYFQNRYTDSGINYPATSSRRFGVGQYNAFSAPVVKDASGRITSLIDQTGKQHQFGYVGSSANVETWTVQ